MNNKSILIIVLIIAVGAGIWVYSGGKGAKNISGQQNAVIAENQTVTSAASQGSVKEFTVVGTDFAFAPSTIEVNKGDKVKIIFKDSDGFHDLRIEGYNVGTERIKSVNETSVEFVADKSGSFEYYCSVGTHRDRGMKGTLIVK